MNSEAVVRLLKKEMAAAGGLRALCRKHSISPAYVSTVSREETEPGAAILNILGLERIVTYRRKNKACLSG